MSLATRRRAGEIARAHALEAMRQRARSVDHFARRATGALRRIAGVAIGLVLARAHADQSYVTLDTMRRTGLRAWWSGRLAGVLRAGRLFVMRLQSIRSRPCAAMMRCPQPSAHLSIDTETNSMIHLENVEKSFPLAGGRTWVLRNVNLDIADGEFVSVMGPRAPAKVRCSTCSA